MDNEFIDAIITKYGEESCLESEKEFKGENFNFKQVGKRIRELKLEAAMEGGMSLEEAIERGLVSRTQGYLKFPQPRNVFSKKDKW
jgi:hypothetical protein